MREFEEKDDRLVQQLENARAASEDRSLATYLLALVHLERGDGDSSLSLLQEAAQWAPTEMKVQVLLEQVQSGAIPLGCCMRTFTGHTRSIWSVCLSTDERWVLSGGDDQTMRLWEIASGQCLCIFTGHESRVNAVCLSVDGRWALSGSGNAQKDRNKDNTVRLWEVATGRCLRTFTGHTSEVTSVCLSTDGRWALSGSDDKTIRLWEVATGRCLRTFTDHAAGVTSACLSSDGRWVLSGSEDQTVRLWETSTGRCLRTFTGHTKEVTSVYLSGDGRWALSGSEDETMRLWELDWELEAHNPADWDTGALPYLELFLTLHSPHAGMLKHRGKPIWNEQDFQDLIRQLQYVGYGWLRPEGVRRKLEEMAGSWRGPRHLSNNRWSRLFRFR